MAVLVYLVVLLAFVGRCSAVYCVCKDGVGDTQLQKTLDYACGAGADCTPILQNGACFQPNTVKDHCSYAVNSYFQRKGQVVGSCDFSQTATTSASPPAGVSSTCVYPSTTGTGTTTPTPGTAGTTTPTAGTGGTTTPTTGTGLVPGTGTGTGTTVTPTPFSTGLGPTGSGFDNSRGAGPTEGRGLAYITASLTLWFSGLVFLQ